MSVGEGFYGERSGPVPAVGQTVLFNKYQGTLVTFKEDGKNVDYRLINDDDILAIVEE